MKSSFGTLIATLLSASATLPSFAGQTLNLAHYNIHHGEPKRGSSSDAVKPTPCAAEFAFMGRTTSLHPGKSVLTVRALSTSLKERTVER